MRSFPSVFRRTSVTRFRSAAENTASLGALFGAVLLRLAWVVRQLQRVRADAQISGGLARTLLFFGAAWRSFGSTRIGRCFLSEASFHVCGKGVQYVAPEYDLRAVPRTFP